MGLERSEYSLDEGTSQSVCILFSRQLQRPLSLSSDFEDLRGLLRGETEVHFTMYIQKKCVFPFLKRVYSANSFMFGFLVQECIFFVL